MKERNPLKKMRSALSTGLVSKHRQWPLGASSPLQLQLLHVSYGWSHRLISLLQKQRICSHASLSMPAEFPHFSSSTPCAHTSFTNEWVTSAGGLCNTTLSSSQCNGCHCHVPHPSIHPSSHSSLIHLLSSFASPLHYSTIAIKIQNRYIDGSKF